MKVEKVLLAIPNFRWQNWKIATLWNVHPYNICLLSAMIEREYNVVIVDANIDDLSKEEFDAILKKEKPDVVGLTVMTNEYSRAGHIAAEVVKNADSSIVVVFCGVYATNSYLSVIEDKNVDYVVVGEGEYVFKNLLGYLNGRNDLPARGIVYKRNGKIITTPREDFITDLDSLPLPAYHKIDFLKYADLIQRESVDRPRRFPFARVLTSRGCSVGCSFCEAGYISGGKFRSRSPLNVVNEIEWLINEYGIKSVLFDDDNMLLNRKRAKDIFREMLKRNLNVTWNVASLAVFLLDDELLELMKESGCQFLDVSIESGVERVLKEIIRKPLKLENSKKMVKKAKELGIDVVASFVVGFPGETWDEIRQTIRFAENFEADYVKIAIATPLPNTELYQTAKYGGYLREDFSFDDMDWSRGQIETDEFTRQDLTILRAYEWDRINFTDPQRRKNIARMMNITEDELNKIRKRTLRSIKL